MKCKYFLISLVCMIFLSGCGNSNSDNDWENNTNYGDINLELTEVDRNDFEMEWEIDNYLNITEQNQNDKDNMKNDNYRLYYNKIADQTGLPLLYLYEANAEEKDGNIIYDLSKDGIGNYLTNNDDGKLIYIKCEIPINTESDETYMQSISKIMAPIYGGVPYLKKYDLNEIFTTLASELKKEKATYKNEFAGIEFRVTRDYNWATVYICVQK